MRRVASTTVMLRISPGACENSRTSSSDLHPVAGVEAQHVVAAQRLELQLAARDHAGDAAADAGVLARPLERGAGAGLAGIMDLAPGKAGSRARDSRRSAAARTDRRPAATSNVPVVSTPVEGAMTPLQPGRSASGDAQVVPAPASSASTRTCQTVCSARARFDADCTLDQVGLLEMRDLAVPDVEVDEVAPGASAAAADRADRAARHSGSDR